MSLRSPMHNAVEVFLEPISGISLPTLKLALQALLAQPVAQPEALLYLALVDERLSYYRLPNTIMLRSYVLSIILTTMITSTYNGIRVKHELSEIDLLTSHREALEAIAQDSTIKSEILLGWSAFYYRYICPELNISVGLFAQNAATHPRTMSRYYQQTLSRLAYQLIDAECKLRMQLQKAWLITHFNN